MARQSIENGATGLVVRTRINDNFIELYDRNELTDAERTKLTGVESGAEVNNITDLNASDLTDGAESTLHYHSSDRSMDNAVETANNKVLTNTERDAIAANTLKNTYPTADATKLSGIEAGAEVNQTNAEIKTQYEANANTNALTDSEKTQLTNQSGQQSLITATNVADVYTLDCASLPETNHKIVNTTTDAKTINTSNLPTGDILTITLKIENTAAAAFTFGSEFDFSINAQPTMTIGQTWLLGGISYDNGTTFSMLESQQIG